jgi:hypothetical protein
MAGESFVGITKEASARPLVVAGADSFRKADCQLFNKVTVFA